MNQSEPSASPIVSGYNRFLAFVVACIAALFSLVIYYFTCHRTIAWWDSGEYTTAALTLGVAHPPGSVLLTIIGWLVTKLPVGISKAFSLNLLASVLAAVTVAGVCYVAARILPVAGRRGSSDLFRTGHPVAISGVLLAGLMLGHSNTLWLYAVKFTPYILTALFTVLILWAMLQWWESADRREAVKWLFLIGLLFGLDFSVHRTNLLMLPVFALWLAIRNPRTFLSPRAWVFGGVGLLAGLAFHLVIMPMAAANPILNSNDPSTITRLWEYVSLKQYGGGWLVNLYPRKTPFWSHQLVDYIKTFGNNFCYIDGKLGLLGVVPAFLGVYGLVALLRRSWRLALSVLALFLMMSLGVVIYLNIPEFFRTFDRHYMPSFVLTAVLMAYGAAHLLSAALSWAGVRRWVAAFIIVILAGGAAANQVLSNYESVDGSHSFYASDSARNYLAGLEQNAIIFTTGDNDTWPPLYLQTAENYRRDVSVINLGLLNTSWYLTNLQNREPDFPLKLSSDDFAGLAPRPFPDTTVSIPFIRSARHTDSATAGEGGIDTLLIRLSPGGAQKYFLVQDQLLLRIIKNNNWVRPIYFTSPYGWLKSHLRPEGIVQRLVTPDASAIDRQLLADNLFNKYTYRGFKNPFRPLDFATRWVGINLLTSFLMLAHEYHQAGEYEECRRVMNRMNEVISVDIIDPPDQLRALARSLCVQP